MAKRGKMIRTKVVELPEGRVADIQDTTITWVSNGPMGTMIKVHKDQPQPNSYCRYNTSPHLSGGEREGKQEDRGGGNN